MRKKIFIICLLIMFFAGCGKKGPLVLEPENQPPALENFQVRQIGNQIELAWKLPDLLSDKKEPFETALVSRVYVYHYILKTGETLPADIFIKKAGLLAKLKAAEIKGINRNASSYRISFKNKDLQDKTHGFALIYFYGRKKSAAGQWQKIKTMPAPPPLENLKISRNGKTIILNWSRPVSEDQEQSTIPAYGYRIYRRINGAGNLPDFRPVNSEKVINEYFHDADTGADGEYEYQVSSCLNEQVESAPSNMVKIKVLDTFPPDVPGNLVAFTAKDQIFLTWETVSDADLANYRVYRKISEKEDFKLLADQVTDNFFRDKQVKKGQLYIYAISAVDKKGNESETSRTVQQLFE